LRSSFGLAIHRAFISRRYAGSVRTFTPIHHAAVICVAAVLAASCSRAVRVVTLDTAPNARLEELWQEPADLTARDLFNGPGGMQGAPPGTTFEFIARDTSGYSGGFDVRDSNGTEWSVKTGPEAQSEVVTSRLLWGIGYHQPSTYYLSAWTLTGQVSGPQQPGRFRPELPSPRVVGEWSWYENPFVDAREYRGLVVANLILNSWDWKTSNNKIYELAEPVNGVRRWFVVRDVGASLGRTTYPAILKLFRLRGFGQGTRNDLAGFEQQGFITKVDGQDLEFDYRGIYRDVIDTVTPADVRWTCTLFSRLSDRQWADAFRAGGYTDEQTARYVKKIKEKIAQGLALATDAGD
jgi:hypothetical protein